MSDIAVRVENLSKKYSIGRAQGARSSGGGLRHALQDAVITPWNAIRKLGKRQEERDNGFDFNSRPSALSTSFEDFWALKNVSFEVKRGEVLGIIGRNGAGKSTLLKILSRITEPSSGRIGIKGRVASLLEVGTGFHPELTGRENIFLNGAILGMSRSEVKRKFDEIVSFAEVEKFLNTPVKRYSSGMYVRLAFAVAAHLETEILIVDEVLAVGDAAFQKKCLGRMKTVSSSGRTVLFVSHDLSTVQNLCHRCILLDTGSVVLAAESSTVVAKYLAWKPTSADPFTSIPRDPSVAAQLTGFKVSDIDGQNAPRAGYPCSFTVELIANQSVSSLRIAVGINDKYGRRLLTIDTNHYGVSYSVEPGRHRIQCRLASLPLKPDEYRVHLFIGDTYGAYDYIDGKLGLCVEPPSIYPNPSHDETHGPVVQPQEWSKSIGI